MPITVQTDQHCSYDYMETFIDSESNEGCVVFCPSQDIGEVCYESDDMTSEQWGQIVELDKEMMEVFSDCIRRAVKILEGREDTLAA